MQEHDPEHDRCVERLAAGEAETSALAAVGQSLTPTKERQQRSNNGGMVPHDTGVERATRLSSREAAPSGSQ